MANDKIKVTFYADQDIKDWLDRLDSRVKSHTINTLLREALQQRTSLEDRLTVLEMRLKTIERDVKHDGFTIGAIRRVLMNRFGDRTTAELQKEFDDLMNASAKSRQFGE